MDNIFSILQEIFTGKENETFKIGLSDYKNRENTVRHSTGKRFRKSKPQELRLSELMRRSSY